MAGRCVVDVAVLFFFALVMVLWFFGDEHFDRVPKQNLKFQFECVYCAPLGKPV